MCTIQIFKFEICFTRCGFIERTKMVFETKIDLINEFV